MRQKLDRTLGLFSAITISVGTMIGSAIFVLAGQSYATAGPSASLAVFMAGMAAVFTGFSFAELVTLIPRTGGGYAYVREATDNGVIGFISGWGFWLGYAMSCGLFALGFGNFLNYFIPAIPPMAAAYVLVIYVVGTNIRGVKNTGRLQNVITTAMVVLLLGYIVSGFFHMEPSYQRPYFPMGFSGTLSAMGFLYMTYIGYGLITTASEEVIQPEKTIPRAIFISLAVVIFLKTAAFVVGSGVLPWQQLVPAVTGTPMIDTSVRMYGPAGGYLFAAAGILATLSSINTAVMASSRTSFAMAKNQHMPTVFRKISITTRTPVFSLLVTGLIVLAAVTIRDLAVISSVTSIFSLTGYSLVNLAVMILRRRRPEDRRAFRVPLYPLTPLAGILVNMFLVYQLGRQQPGALLAATGILLAGLAYYYLGVPGLRKAPRGLSTAEVPLLRERHLTGGDPLRNRILVPVLNPATLGPLMDFAHRLALREAETEVMPLHIIDVPPAVPMAASFEALEENISRHDAVIERLRSYEQQYPEEVRSLVIYSRDIAHGVLETLRETSHPTLLISWYSMEGHSAARGVVARLLEDSESDVMILKDNRQTRSYRNILFPYGGGPYSRDTARLVRRIGLAYGATITLVRITDDPGDHPEMLEDMAQLAAQLGPDTRYLLHHGELVEELTRLSSGYDLMVLGVSLDWGIAQRFTGLKTDAVAREAHCPVLLVKSYNALLQRRGVRSGLHRFKEMIS